MTVTAFLLPTQKSDETQPTLLAAPLRRAARPVRPPRLWFVVAFILASATLAGVGADSHHKAIVAQATNRWGLEHENLAQEQQQAIALLDEALEQLTDPAIADSLIDDVDQAENQLQLPMPFTTDEIDAGSAYMHQLSAQLSAARLDLIAKWNEQVSAVDTTLDDATAVAAQTVVTAQSLLETSLGQVADDTVRTQLATAIAQVQSLLAERHGTDAAATARQIAQLRDAVAAVTAQMDQVAQAQTQWVQLQTSQAAEQETTSSTAVSWTNPMQWAWDTMEDFYDWMVPGW